MAKKKKEKFKGLLNRQVLKKQPVSILDLRSMTKKEEPIKQHGFKEEEIGHGNLL